MQSLYGILRRVWKRTMRGETDRKRPAEKVGPGDVKENTSDDLTVIRGIGIAS
jgi:predicted flap endonuclease-1-like 5' DNA nuclease